MSPNAKTSAPTGRKRSNDDVGRVSSHGVPGDAVLGHESQNTSSPEGAKENRVLPNGWRWAQMSEVCTRVQDGTHFSPKEQARTGDFKYITAKNIKHWGLDLSDVTYVPERVHREIYKRCNVEKGDVLYIKDGVTTGIATVNTLDEEFSLLSSVALLKPRRDILDSLFLKYYLNSPEGFRNMTGQMTGTAIKRLILQKIKAAVVPIAPFDEQRRIVAEIEKQFTRLEAGVAALRRVQANLKRYRAAVLKAACEGKLVPTEAELHKSELRRQKDEASSSFLTPPSSFESGKALLRRILEERRKNWTGRGKYKEPAAPDTANLPPLPEGWTWATLDQLLIYLRNGWGSKPNAEAGTPILRISANRPMSVNLDDVRFLNGSTHDYAEYFVTEGDLLFTRYNGNPNLTGVCGVVPSLDTNIVHPDKLIRVRLVPELCLARFVGMVANVGVSRAFVASRARTTAGQTGISGPDLRGTPVMLPPLAEQTRIVAEVERRLSVVEELEAAVSANLQRAVRLRQSILQRAFTGELV